MRSTEAARPLEAEYREVLGRYATGVALVTATVNGSPLGLIVNSLASVSLDPPLVSFCPSRASRTWRRMRTAGRFGVNVLGAQHEELARRAARPGADRFSGVEHAPSAGGAPAIAGALAFADCAIEAEMLAGDHWIVLGRVTELRAAAGDPLLFWDSGYFTLPAPR
jgi:3-hydroxy-9,10-secoandrosta-1,3,5(10)-triene-9,17-dione monooxygenase reductase component